MHLFKTRMKCLLRNKTKIFWTLLFPLIMALLFNFAFKGLMTGQTLKTINVAIEENEYLTDNFLTMITKGQISENVKLFNVLVKSYDEAKTLLDKNGVEGIISFTNQQEISLTFNNDGINQTIIKTFLDEYLQANEAITNITIISNGDVDVFDLVEAMTNKNPYLKEKVTKRGVANNALNYFYALIGMAIVYGGFWGTDIAINLQANLSPKGMRMAISPVKRFKLLLIYFLCAFIIHFSEIIILLLFMNYGLGIVFNNNILLILLICAIGSLTGITYGAFVALALKKASEGVKIALTTITGVVGGFLAGMMTPSVKYFIITNIPPLAYLNPVNVITDGLYSLSYFPTNERFFLNIMILTLMVTFFSSVSYLFFKRDSYESI